MSRWLLAAAIASALGCSKIDREFECEVSAECVRGERRGQCLPPGHCAFPDNSCFGGYRWDLTAASDLAGECVGETSGPDGGPMFLPDGGVNACGGNVVLAGAPGSPCGPCDTGTYTCEGENAVACQGAASSSTPIDLEAAEIDAETEYSADFSAAKAVDGLLTTSWFSTGPDGDGSPTVFTWQGAEERCIDTISIISNAGHSEETFHAGYGFGLVTVEVIDESAAVTYSETFPLDQNDPETEPDPDVLAETGGVPGERVVLELSDHESPDCGGFAELEITQLQ